MSKYLYLSDPMGDPEEEVKEIKRTMNRLGLKIPDIEMIEFYPKDLKYDVLFFDWGGMSVGNSIMETYCRYMINDCQEHPGRAYVMVSSFTALAMEDALSYFGNEEIKVLSIFLNIEDAYNWLKSLE